MKWNKMKVKVDRCKMSINFSKLFKLKWNKMQLKVWFIKMNITSFISDKKTKNEQFWCGSLWQWMLEFVDRILDWRSYFTIGCSSWHSRYHDINKGIEKEADSTSGWIRILFIQIYCTFGTHTLINNHSISILFPLYS